MVRAEIPVGLLESSDTLGVSQTKHFLGCRRAARTFFIIECPSSHL